MTRVISARPFGTGCATTRSSLNYPQKPRTALYNTEDLETVEHWLFKYLLPPVRKLVIEHWNDIAAVGDLLVQRGELSQAETTALLRWSKARFRSV
jgi:hypothetical protein